MKHKIVGKCGGGKKLGVSYNFKSEKAFLLHINKLCGACGICGKICFKSELENNNYICKECKNEL